MRDLGPYDESIVAFVRAMMEYVGEQSGPCLGAEAHEQNDGCDSCGFDRLFDPLPHALRIAAIRYAPATKGS